MTTTVKSRNEILATLQAHKPELQQEFPLHRLALFGSWARGDQTEASDIDLETISKSVVALERYRAVQV